MIKSMSAAAIVAAASLSFAVVAQAGDIPATPMNHGPLVMTGMGPVSALGNVALTPLNVLTPPVQQIGAGVTTAVAGPVAPAAEPMPMKRKRHHRMMKHKMMK